MASDTIYCLNYVRAHYASGQMFFRWSDAMNECVCAHSHIYKHNRVGTALERILQTKNAKRSPPCFSFEEESSLHQSTAICMPPWFGRGSM